jgi:hypothetical protein
VPDDENKPALEARQPAALMAPTGNEYKRQIAARFFAVAGPPVAARLQWVEEDARNFERLLKSDQKPDIAYIREWEKRERFVCHTVFAEPTPPSLDRLTDFWRVWRPLADGIKCGRPTSRDLVRPEAQRRLAAGEVPEELLLKEFGTALSNWLAENHPNAPSMSAERLEKCVRDLWHAAGRGR